ncbi:barstar family protein [Microbacterium oleivorans]|uniref:barstar family protein n=1 Tax=Microbacterium oleivorans TaxID=273677 RepID=UPI0021169709|nr:barstar family protein [Microbacterium oleivorans]
MTDTFRLDGRRIRDIPSLYAELDRVLMPDEPWQLGESMDALDDLLYGGYGVLARATGARIVWTDHERARIALGVDATRAWYQGKLARPGLFAAGPAQAALDDLDRGAGATYFDLVVRVFADHPEVDLVLD